MGYRFLLAAGLLSLFFGRATVRSDTLASQLTIRTYNTIGLPAADLLAARSVADAIFARAGVSLRWRECRTSTGPSAASPDACDDAVSALEAVIRVVPAPARQDRRSLGFSYLLRGQRASWLATVFADRVTWLARQLRLDRGQLLGLALSHEVGHLFLGNGGHSTSGLMRGEWDRRTLRRITPDDWLFSQEEATEVQRELTSRSKPDAVPTIDLASRGRPRFPQPR